MAKRFKAMWADKWRRLQYENQYKHLLDGQSNKPHGSEINARGQWPTVVHYAGIDLPDAQRRSMNVVFSIIYQQENSLSTWAGHNGGSNKLGFYSTRKVFLVEGTGDTWLLKEIPNYWSNSTSLFQDTLEQKDIRSIVGLVLKRTNI